VHVSHVSELCVSAEQHDSRDQFGPPRREISCHPGSQRFTDEISRAICREGVGRFVSGGIQGMFRGFSRAIRVAGIFENINIQCRDLLNRVGVVGTLKGAIAVSVKYHYVADGWLTGAQSLPANELSVWALPGFEILRVGGFRHPR
jgi:hypothetical protein